MEYGAGGAGGQAAVGAVGAVGAVVRLGAWCDLETEEDARARLLADGPAKPVTPGAEPAPGRYVPAQGEPVLSPGSLSFQVEEFAVLADGRRLRLHAERGFGTSIGGAGAAVDPWAFLTPESVTADVLNTVLPDDAEQTGEDHPWPWLCELLQAHGVRATPNELRRLPYDVELSERLLDRLREGRA